MRRHLTPCARVLTLVAVTLALVATSLGGPVAAQSDRNDGFVSAENARHGRHRRAAEAAPPFVEDRVARFEQRAELVAELDLSRFALNTQAAIWSEARTDQQHLEPRIPHLAPVDRRLATARAEVDRLQADLDRLDAAMIDTSVLEPYGLEFAVFPVEAPTEFVNSWGAARSGGRGHKGTDILSPYGTELRAIEDGVIERVSNSALGGLALYLQGDSGARYFYAHLQDLADKGDGDRVRAGDIVGFNGDSGNARGTPHLHFQWAPEGGEGWRNPYPLLEALWLAERQVPLPQR